jgi:hypothetical protein
MTTVLERFVGSCAPPATVVLAVLTTKRSCSWQLRAISTDQKDDAKASHRFRLLGMVRARDWAAGRRDACPRQVAIGCDIACDNTRCRASNCEVLLAAPLTTWTEQGAFVSSRTVWMRSSWRMAATRRNRARAARSTSRKKYERAPAAAGGVDEASRAAGDAGLCRAQLAASPDSRGVLEPADAYGDGEWRRVPCPLSDWPNLARRRIAGHASAGVHASDHQVNFTALSASSTQRSVVAISASV